MKMLVKMMLFQSAKERCNIHVVCGTLQNIKDTHPVKAASSLPEIEGAVGGLSFHEGGSQAAAIPTAFLAHKYAKLQFRKISSYHQEKEADAYVGISSKGVVITRTEHSFIKYKYTGRHFEIIDEKAVPSDIVRRCSINIHNGECLFL